jgi:lipopolysaccharide biosynthesis glycosyltransferase
MGERPTIDALLVTASDEHYAGAASLALISAAKATSLRVRCVVLADGLSPETATRMTAAFARADVPMDIVELKNDDFMGLPVQEPWGRTTFARLFLGRSLGGRSSLVLWLDADTLTIGSIDGLLKVDLEGCAVAAVPDAAVPFVSSPSGVLGWRRLGIAPGVGYFNAGVMLVDAERWRKDRVEERAIELIREFPEEAVFADQSPLNAVVAGSWLPLDSRWNARARNSFVVELGGWVVTRGGVRRAQEVSVLHWAGSVKPWDSDHGPSPDRRRYMEARERWVRDLPLPASRVRRSWQMRKARGLFRAG